MTPTSRPTPLPAARRLAAATLAALALNCLASPALALQSKAQQACILTVHKAFAAVAKAEAREAASCLKAAALGDLVQPTVVDCIDADVRSKVAAARAKAAARVQDKCEESPDFGPADSTGAAAVTAAGATR